jgi:deoxyribodipyrimidine photolyase-related protein
VSTAFLIFPHQLYQDTSEIPGDAKVFLIEEYLFFAQYKFHKQKLVFHRASMKAYESFLTKRGFDCTYIESGSEWSDIRKLIIHLKKEGFTKVVYPMVTDYWLEQRLQEGIRKNNLSGQKTHCQLFINSPQELTDYFAGGKKYFQTDFYIHQRKSRRILLVDGDKPKDGKWSFDIENRLKYPRDKVPPKVIKLEQNVFYKEAVDYVSKKFGNNYGEISSEFVIPTTHREAEKWFDDFLKNRFEEFGLYEDAIVAKEQTLHHSMLSPVLNAGLLLPGEVIEKAISYADEHDIPYNNLEGFVRQILGWREFMRAIYAREGRKQRTTNYWKFTRRMPDAFYNGTTGILPVDETIKKLLNSGYTHHIERLMILSNFMLLCEIHPNDVYQWFMEMYIDAYDWVMVPNVYGMGQFADGGLICTKPYISSSNYILKMSDYKGNQPWTEIWDALFWRFMSKQRDFFLSNPRLGMLIKTYDKMDLEKRDKLGQVAEQFLENLNK